MYEEMRCSTHRINSDGVIKVADFGLAEELFTKDYFRQDKSDTVRLPFKWMAPESLKDGVFSEKTDVVCVSEDLSCTLVCISPRHATASPPPPPLLLFFLLHHLLFNFLLLFFSLSLLCYSGHLV